MVACRALLGMGTWSNTWEAGFLQLELGTAAKTANVLPDVGGWTTFCSELSCSYLTPELGVAGNQWCFSLSLQLVAAVQVICALKS